MDGLKSSIEVVMGRKAMQQLLLMIMFSAMLLWQQAQNAGRRRR